MRRRYAVIIMFDEDRENELTAEDKTRVRGRAAEAFPEAMRVSCVEAGWASTGPAAPAAFTAGVAAELITATTDNPGDPS